MAERRPRPERRPVPEQPQRPGPIGGDLAAEVYGLAQRLRMPSLVARHNSRLVIGAYSAINGLLSIALMSVAAVLTGAPFIFPSLGPTAFLVFYTPMAPPACPRNTICGHAIGAAAGYLSLVVFGLTNAPPALTTSVTWDRVGAAALSLGLTAGVMVWLGVPHPPAGATTLIVSLGILATPWKLGVLMIAVFLLVVQALVINRLAGIEYPIWSPRPPPSPASG
ncbi:MAG: HPP family protein [Acidimicrobiia bacterium]|nr:HPP family protein [Acidimicrobiia bacterium]